MKASRQFPSTIQRSRFLPRQIFQSLVIELGLRQGYPGQLTISITANNALGLSAIVNITWAAGTTGSTSSGTTTGVDPCPHTDGSCSTPDPFNGGYCRNGGWVPADHPARPACAQ